MSEQGMRQTVVDALSSRDAISVENPAYPGTPDVNFIEGWIELKWLRNWPVRAETPVVIDHFTPQQRVWLKRRWLAGGNATLLIQCWKEWLLFDGQTAADFVGRVNKAELFSRAIWVGDKGLDKEQLLGVLDLLSLVPKHKRVDFTKLGGH